MSYFFFVGYMEMNKKLDLLKGIVVITIAAFLEGLTVVLFANPGNFVSSGFTGLAMILSKLPFWKLDISLTMLLFNIPVALFCIKEISPRFTFLSLLYVFEVSIFIEVIPFQAIFTDKLLLAIFGGVLLGLASVLALNVDASTGGIDFIALYFSKKYQKTLWEYVFVYNVILILINGLIEGWDSIAYSIIFQYVATQLRQTFHTRYKRLTLQIFTKKPKEVIDCFTKLSLHGLTCTPSYGGFSEEEITMITTIVSAYEQNILIRELVECDKDILINIMPSEVFVGKFVEKEYK